MTMKVKIIRIFGDPLNDLGVGAGTVKIVIIFIHIDRIISVLISIFIHIKTRLTFSCAHLGSTKESLSFEYSKQEKKNGDRKRRKIFGEGNHF